MELKNTLSQLRKDKGLTQQELAETLHVSRQTISRWEVGTSIPTLENLVCLSELYQIPLNDLVRRGPEASERKVEPIDPPSAKGKKRKMCPPFRYAFLAALGLLLLAGALQSHLTHQTWERNNIMDIINSVRTGFYRPVQSAAARTVEAAAGSFTEQTKSYYGVSGSGGGTPIISPLLKLRMDYNQWKEVQPPQEIPDSQGPTEENLAYLRERYAGPLTMFRKMEALDTMFTMGIITTEQRSAFYGEMELKTWTAGQAELRVGPLEEDGPSSSFSALMAQQEAELYRLSPLAKSDTLDDLFSWLEEL